MPFFAWGEAAREVIPILLYWDFCFQPIFTKLPALLRLLIHSLRDNCPRSWSFLTLDGAQWLIDKPNHTFSGRYQSIQIASRYFDLVQKYLTVSLLWAKTWRRGRKTTDLSMFFDYCVLAFELWKIALVCLNRMYKMTHSRRIWCKSVKVTSWENGRRNANRRKNIIGPCLYRNV